MSGNVPVSTVYIKKESINLNSSKINISNGQIQSATRHVKWLKKTK